MRMGILVLSAITLISISGCGSSQPASSSGITITSNKSISKYTTDMCTQYTGEQCIFSGGQKVTFSDGSILLTGQWVYQYSNGGDTDTNENTVSILVPSSSTATYQILSSYVARGSGYRKAFLVYSRSSDTISLYADDSNDSTCCTSDTKLADLTVSDL